MSLRLQYGGDQGRKYQQNVKSWEEQKPSVAGSSPRPPARSACAQVQLRERDSREGLYAPLDGLPIIQPGWEFIVL